MQVAARRVAWENAQLRDLLQSNGVLPGEIERFLRSRGRAAAHIPSVPVAGRNSQDSAVPQVRKNEGLRVARPTDQTPCDMVAVPLGAGGKEDCTSIRHFESHLGVKNPGVEPNMELSQWGSQAREPRSSDPTQASNSAEDEHGYDASFHPCTVDAEQNNVLPTASACFCPDPPASGSLTRDNSLLEMSCETAASIISGMRGSGDREQARSQLGCKGGEHCNVKNVKVFQVMDMD